MFIRSCLFYVGYWKSHSPHSTSFLLRPRYQDQLSHVHFSDFCHGCGLNHSRSYCCHRPITLVPVISRELVQVSSPVVCRELLQVSCPVVATNLTILMAPGSAVATVDKRTNENIVLAVLVQSAAIATAVCGIN